MRSLKTLALALSLSFGLSATALAENGYLGVYLTEEAEGKDGALVEGVKKDSPAAKAGLKKGDVILEWNGTKTPNGAVLIKLILASKPGDKIKMVAARDGWSKSLELVLGGDNPEAPKKPEGKPAAPSEGSGFLGVYLKPGEGEGAHVDGSVKGSPARKAGLQAGDVIVALNDKPVKNEQALIEMLKGSKVGQKIKLRVVREGWGKDVELSLGERPAPEASEEPKPEPKPESKPEVKPEPKPAAKQKGFLGVALIEKDGKVIVDEVQAGSPADKSAMQKGDVIISIDGKVIGSIDDLAAVMGGKFAGDKLGFVIEREGWKRKLDVTLAPAE